MRHVAAAATNAWRGALAVSIAVVLGLGGCTVIRYVDKNKGGGGGGGGPDTKTVDALVQIDLQRSAANLSPSYQRILQALSQQLAKKHVQLGEVALAPMYRRSGGTVPLLYGKGDRHAEFGSLGGAVRFYTRDNGAEELTERSAVDGENLAALGLQLDERAIYHPTTSDPSGRGYFGKPKDGFLVVSLTASGRECAASSSECQLDGQHPGRYFTQASDGDATWLELPGEKSLSPGQIFHLSIVTAEGTSYDEFYEDCTSQPNFPKTQMDYMDVSDKKYYRPLTQRIRKNGGHARTVDLCKAMSSNRDQVMQSVAGAIRGMF